VRRKKLLVTSPVPGVKPKQRGSVSAFHTGRPQLALARASRHAAACAPSYCTRPARAAAIQSPHGVIANASINAARHASSVNVAADTLGGSLDRTESSRDDATYGAKYVSRSVADGQQRNSAPHTERAISLDSESTAIAPPSLVVASLALASTALASPAASGCDETSCDEAPSGISLASIDEPSFIALSARAELALSAAPSLGDTAGAHAAAHMSTITTGAIILNSWANIAARSFVGLTVFVTIDRSAHRSGTSGVRRSN
jgi:hypothetical protein